MSAAAAIDAGLDFGWSPPKQSAFVKSNFARVADDHYPTIDARCLNALLACRPLPTNVWEPCSPGGSALADQLEAAGHVVERGVNVLVEDPPPGCRDAVTNPPYAKPICNQIVFRLVELVRSGALDSAAVLVRSQWDHAGSRAPILGGWPFAGLVRLRFRPWWSEERKKSPIHSYQWAVWDRDHLDPPTVQYFPR